MVLKNEVEVTQRDIDSKEFLHTTSLSYLNEKKKQIKSKQEVLNILIII